MKKKTLLGVILGFLVLIFLILYFLPQPKSPTEEPALPFEQCELLAASCLDKDCPYYFLCEGIEFTFCSIYDCKDSYGILIKTGDNRMFTREQPKPDEQKIRELTDRCQGAVEVLEKGYKDGKLEIKAKVTTEGECQIVAFVVKTKDGYQTPLFEKNDSYYKLILDSLPAEIFKVIAVGEGGVSIREK